MADFIEMQYEKALEQAKKLEQIADRMSNSTKKDVERTLSDLRSGWQGDVADKYIQKGIDLEEKISKTAKNLYDAANAVRRIAKAIHDAEAAAAAIAGRRSY